MIRFNVQQKKNAERAQTAVEYILLLGTVMAIVLVGFHTNIPRVFNAANVYQNRIFEGIAGPPPKCGNGVPNGTGEISRCSFQ